MRPSSSLQSPFLATNPTGCVGEWRLPVERPNPSPSRSGNQRGPEEQSSSTRPLQLSSLKLPQSSAVAGEISGRESSQSPPHDEYASWSESSSMLPSQLSSMSLHTSVAWWLTSKLLSSQSPAHVV